MEGVLEADPEYFEQRPDATKRMGIHPILKITSVLRMFAYALPADSLDENLEMSRTVVYNNIKHFVDAVDKRFGGEYLRSPTASGMERLLEINACRGFVASGGQAHLIFDDRSPVFDSLMNGEAPGVGFKLNGHYYDMAYCLAGEIYPDWAVFVKTLHQPRGNKQQIFAQNQDELRKDVARAFGVLQARWRILAVPCKLFSRLDMNKVMRACIIMHNMICEENRHHGYLVNADGEDEASYNLRVTRPEGHRPRCIGELMSRINAIANSSRHFMLQEALVEEVWRRFGEEDEC
ncbi:unnamed protein product [Phytophthora fragariaefolia]|uniref:Unnamed protein product n=1 Tax=Phytophthora fragariaefolia TaxID=1490495 RepID=A0A9W6Y7Q4_9STRA|nr:unnamed protein product [Phytophthora fragariaefolia]